MATSLFAEIRGQERRGELPISLNNADVSPSPTPSGGSPSNISYSLVAVALCPVSKGLLTRDRALRLFLAAKRVDSSYPRNCRCGATWRSRAHAAGEVHHGPGRPPMFSGAVPP